VGQRVEVNLLSTLLSALANQSSAYVLTGTVPHAIGNTHPSVAPYDTYATGAGTLVLAVGTDRQFTRLCAVIGTPELSHEDRFATNQARVRHRHALREHLERALAAAPASQWASALTGKGIPAGTVNTISEAFTLATDLGLAPIRRTDDAADALGLQVASPISLSVTPVTYRTRAPRLGEHSSDIRAWLDATEPRLSTA
jgi:crotonobetainyl-CoA:carnitine CoA-transferase CaiB-like acyl-CoA transferase